MEQLAIPAGVAGLLQEAGVLGTVGRASAAGPRRKRRNNCRLWLHVKLLIRLAPGLVVMLNTPPRRRWHDPTAQSLVTSIPRAPALPPLPPPSRQLAYMWRRYAFRSSLRLFLQRQPRAAALRPYNARSNFCCPGLKTQGADGAIGMTYLVKAQFLQHPGSITLKSCLTRL
jgi:hypothetical protein